jgi:cobalt-zinc-cadmium efflux system membrane fusion protein
MDKQNSSDQGSPNRNLEGDGESRSPQTPRFRLASKPILLVVAGLVLAVTLVLALFATRRSPSQEGRPVPSPDQVLPAPSTRGTTALRQGELVITVSPEKLDNAHIVTVQVAEQAGMAQVTTGSIRTTGSVASDAYKDTPVFPIAGGIVRQVTVQLGDRAKRGQPLAIIFSTELANSEADYLKMRADYDEHEKAHHRTEQLVEIGAASREDLEQHRAKVDSMRASLASARQLLIQMGLTPQQVDALQSPSQVDSLLSVRAPVSGTVISRSVNIGEVVSTGKELFRIADLSSVWVIGQVYEKDFSAVRIGTRASITAPSYPGRPFKGRVSYVDPRVDAQARTAQIRVEVPNPGEMLKIGMFVDVGLGEIPSGTRGPAVLVPKSAVQTMGTKQVVFVAMEEPGVFVQRQVTVGQESNGQIPVLTGLSAGERVVTDDSFLLRAESLKVHPDQAQDEHGKLIVQ